MRSSLRSTKLYADGMSRALSLVILLVSSSIELLLLIYMIAYGFRALGLVMFVFFLWNLSVCIAMTVYIMSKGVSQRSGYMEVSNYLNLNKIAKDK